MHPNLHPTITQAQLYSSRHIRANLMDKTVFLSTSAALQQRQLGFEAARKQKVPLPLLLAEKQHQQSLRATDTV